MQDTTAADRHRRDWIAAQLAKAPALSPAKRRRVLALLNPSPAAVALLGARPSMALAQTANGPDG